MSSFRRSPRFFAVSTLALLVCSSFGQESGQSLADVARKLRKDTTNDVKMTDADTQSLFHSVDTIFAFASEDTGLPKRAQVKRRMVSKQDVESYVSGRLSKEEYAQRFTEQELSMKKLGFLPRDFNLKEFLVKSTGQEIAGYYDNETKTISLLNWVPLEKQEPILAHELTHALQDQNFDLTKWMKAGEKNGAAGDESAIARKAVVEGQAMVVYIDYMLKPIGRTLEDTPGLIYQMEDPAVKAAIDSQLTHDAPMILREEGTFAYKQGLIFEGELLHKGGKQLAFAGVFQHPPRTSHEVLQPETYINGEKLPQLRIPDLHATLNNRYDLYESGGIGELDVCALLKQYGERKIADELSSGWQGGTYAIFRRKEAGTQLSTADLAVLYVSRWKTPQAADRFARFYATAVPQRYHNATVQPVQACLGKECPISVTQIATEEGPVIVERWEDNRVVVSESFDAQTAADLRLALRHEMQATRADILPQKEIGERLFEISAFRAYAERIDGLMEAEMIRALAPGSLTPESPLLKH